jgi:hypothetical protein
LARAIARNSRARCPGLSWHPRIEEALPVAEARGKKLGGKRSNAFSASCTAQGIAAVKRRADARAADIMPAIKQLQESGASSLHAIAAGLNARGIPTVRGAGKWRPAQVARVLGRDLA